MCISVGCFDLFFARFSKDDFYESHSMYIFNLLFLKNKYIICSKVIPCFQRDCLFCLHENGCITLRVRRSYNSVFTTSSEEPGEFISHNNVTCIFLQNYFINLYVINTSHSMKLMDNPCFKKVEYGYNMRHKKAQAQEFPSWLSGLRI